MDRRKAEMDASGGPRIVMRTDAGTTSSMASSQAKAMMEARLESMVFASEIPVVTGLAVDWEGRIWVGRSGSQVGEAGPIDIIDSSGAYLGTFAPATDGSPMRSDPEGSPHTSSGTSWMFPEWWSEGCPSNDVGANPRRFTKRISLTASAGFPSIGGFPE